MARDAAVSRTYAIGLAGRRGVDVVAAVALVRQALAQWDVKTEGATLTAPERDDDRAAFAAIAATLDVPLAFVSVESLRARKDEVLTRSPRVLAMFGVGSVAEALALVGAGEGGRLLGPRLATERLTCAIAQAPEEGGTA